MPTNNYQITWDPTNKKWTCIEDGAAAYDLVENSTHETIQFDEIAAPAASAAGDSKLYMDSTSKKLKISQNAGAYQNVAPLTTKGDLFAFSTAQGRLAIGTQGYRLQADSSEAFGMKWAPNTDQIGFHLFNNITYVVASTYYATEFRRTGTISKAYARRIGGTGATVNIKRAASNIRSANLSLTTTAWTDFGALQNNTFVPGHDLDFVVATVTGSVTQIAFYIVFADTD
jgi:hypothetical protein